MHNSRLTRLAAALTGLCLCAALFSGCTNLSFESMDAPVAVLPTPDASALAAPVGDSRARYSIRATLYYRTNEGQLSSALRLIHVDPEDDPLRLIIESLLEKPYSSSGLLPIAPEGTELNGVRLSNGIAVVDLNAQALSEGEEYFYIARAAIARTLLGLETVRCVNVLVEGRAAEADGMPLGALTRQDSSASIGYIQHVSEQALLDTDGGFIERQAVLYLPGAPDEPLSVDCATLRLGDKSYLDDLLRAYAAALPGQLFPPEYTSLIEAETGMDEAGKRILSLRLPQELAAYAPQERLIPGLISTLCAFAPHIDAARVDLGGEPVLLAGGFAADEEGLFDPRQMFSLAGSSAGLYFMAQDGSLLRTTRVLPESTLSARSLLSALIDGPSQADAEGLAGVFPQGARSEDVLGIRIADGVAHVHFSSALYSACQAFSPQQERALVYSVVNTLVENLSTVQRVQFYIDGATASTFAGSISIISPLMGNPGLVRE